MKRTAKILSVLLTLLVAVTVIGCIALAASSGSADTGEIRTAKAPEKEGYFLYYDASASSKYSLKQNNDFATTVNSMADGDVIKLLSDVTVSSASDTVLTPGGVGIYIDLNGYTLSLETTSTSTGSHYLIKPAADCKLYVYSSDKANKAAICTYASSGTDVLFNISSSNVEVYMGSAEATPVLSYKNIDNLTTCSKYE